MHVLMVCLGNICRSPMAAAVLDNKASELGANITVGSAGTADYHVGEGPNVMSQQVWTNAGYQYDHTAAQFTIEHFDTADLVLVMDAANRRDVLRLSRGPQDAGKVALLRSYDPTLAELDSDDPRLEVPDPWGGSRSDFEEVLTMVERSVDGLLARLA